MNMAKAVRGFHLRFGSHDLVEPFKQFIVKVLVPKGINLLLLECNTSFQFESHPELSEGTLTKEDAKELSSLCRENGIRLIPLFQCLGHQGWGGGRNSILKNYPQFDETPHVPTDVKWPDFFAPSWCPNHPDVNRLAFELINELIEAFGCDGFHVGMDEVTELADDQCPRCKGHERADLFAKAVKDMHRHIVEKHGLEMFMWGDRLISSEETGYHNRWESDTLGTYKAIDQIPADITITDWHYDRHPSYPSTKIFLEKGFKVIPACWYKTNAAIAFLEESLQAAKELNVQERMPGMLVTSWNGWNKPAFEQFITNQLEGELKELSETLEQVTKRLK
ncbi:family 20 glycosylhydrolase [Bacillus sp. SD088]|uniref:family 20 glycosylhydrolase n=1 Tax=Bacillus sp. SD088 TaxID=2782012 RepID=UPI001A95B3F4|nr:family 20 glycosylhydrolase [Bacillus sp. SD088]MBO0993485.1 family 20 glycosylhydrolase [Bacillus sp. SD088]